MPDLSRATLEQHSVDLRQFIDFRQSTLANGQRLIEASNSSGLTFTLLPDRGLDIWSASYNGMALTWLSQGSPHPAEFGAPWLRQFNGGLLTTCGLLHAGQPETDATTGVYRDLHGNYTRLRTQDISTNGGWQGDDYVLELRGVIPDGVMFGEQFQVMRTYRLTLGKPVIELHDEIENRHDTPLPLMVLYHFNVGYPLVRGGARLITPDEAVYPYNDIARAGLERWSEYDAAIPGYTEQVFLHHLRAGADHMARVALVNEEFGLQFEWDTRREPFLTQWKNVRRGIYVCGIEPGNCIPEGQNNARARGRLVMLEPGEVHTFTNRLTILPNSAAIAHAEQTIQEIHASGTPLEACQLDNFKSRG
jgi:hypothetical protein